MLARFADKVLGPVVVEVAEERSHQRLVPDSVAVDITHHPGEPGTPRTSGAKDPDHVLRPYAAGYISIQPPGSCPQRPALSRYLLPGLFEPSGPPGHAGNSWYRLR
jgi:hypothetical protein